jgi:exosortase family protein XrtM
MNESDPAPSDSPPKEASTARPHFKAFAWRVFGFLAIFMALQAGWEATRGTWVERLWIHDLTVGSATFLIHLMTPEVKAVAEGSRIVAPGGGLNILLGCEGTDVVFMLAAAFAVFPMAARWRLSGMACGLLWVFVLNQLRIVALFYAFRSNQGLFDLIHATIAPLLVVVLVALFFYAWLQSASPPGRAGEMAA